MSNLNSYRKWRWYLKLEEEDVEEKVDLQKLLSFNIKFIYNRIQIKVHTNHSKFNRFPFLKEAEKEK